MRAVVTGGGGFIGSHLIDALVARGDDVVCIERPGAPWRWLRDLPIEYRGTGLENTTALREACDGADVVFHLAALTEARTPREYYLVNTEGSARILKAAAAHNGGAPRVVFLSSLAAAGPCRNGELLSPDTVPIPLSHYGHSKLMAEVLVHAYQDRVPATILRFTSVYGPRERAVLKLFRMIKHGVALTIGGWDREVSMLYVRDAVQGLLEAADAPRAVGRTYCMAHPEPLTWRSVAYAIGHALHREPRLLSVPASVARVIALAVEGCAKVQRTAAVLNRERVRELTQQRWVCDVSPAERELGFEAAYPLVRGTEETARWYEEERWL
jgi:nucleoside-diphosphate-sugar epimerase